MFNIIYKLFNKQDKKLQSKPIPVIPVTTEKIEFIEMEFKIPSDVQLARNDREFEIMCAIDAYLLVNPTVKIQDLLDRFREYWINNDSILLYIRSLLGLNMNRPNFANIPITLT